MPWAPFWRIWYLVIPGNKHVNARIRSGNTYGSTLLVSSITFTVKRSVSRSFSKHWVLPPKGIELWCYDKQLGFWEALWTPMGFLRKSSPLENNFSLPKVRALFSLSWWKIENWTWILLGKTHGLLETLNLRWDLIKII